MREPIADAHTHADPDTYGDNMDRITHPDPYVNARDALDLVANTIADIRSLADALGRVYDEPDTADHLEALANALQEVLNRHRKPRRRGLVRRILGG